MVAQRLTRRTAHGFSAKDMGHRPCDICRVVAPTVDAKVERARCCPRIVVRSEYVLNIPRASQTVPRRVARKGKRTALHLKEVGALFHRVPEPSRQLGMGWLRDCGEGKGRILRERKNVCAVRHIVVEREMHLGKMCDTARCDARALHLQFVVGCICAAAAIDRARDARARCDGTFAVAEEHLVACGRPRTRRIGCIDIAADRAARDGNRVSCRRARRPRVGQRTAVEAARNRAARHRGMAVRHRAIPRADIRTIGTRNRAPAYRKGISRRVARRFLRATGEVLIVLDDTAIRRAKRTARDEQRIVLHLVADDRAAAPRLRRRARTVAPLCAVLEAVARHGRPLRGCTVGIRVKDVLVVAVLPFLNGANAAIVIKGNGVRARNKRQQMPRRIARDERIEIRQPQLHPVDIGRCAVR